MKIELFIREANAMRKSGLRYVPYMDHKISAAYSVLHRFAIKHPDSKRTAKSRKRTLERRTARAIL